MAADGSIVIDTKILDGKFDKDLNLIKKGLATLTASATAFGIKSLSVGKNFEKSMSQVAATMGLTVEEIHSGTGAFAELEKAARKAGSDTEWSASQAADALNYLALAGYDAEKSIKTLPTVLNLATAGGLDLAYASDMITDAMSALSLQVENIDDFSDVLVKTSQKSNTSVGQLGEAILSVGGTAKILKGGVVELSSALGVLANNGIKGAEGGIALRNIINTLSAPTDIAAKELKRLGISAFDSAGNMRNLQNIFEDFNEVFANMTQQQKQEALSNIFNVRDLKSVQALLKSTSGELKNLQTELNNSTGATKQTAKVMQDNLSGSLKSLNSKFEELSITIFSEIAPALKDAVDDLSNFVSEFTKTDSVKEFSQSLKDIVILLKDFVKTLIENAVPVFNTFVSILKVVKDNINLIIGAFASYKVGVIAMSVANGVAVATMTTAWTAFNTFFMTTVVGAVVAGIVYVGKQLYDLVSKTKQAKSEIDRLNQSEDGKKLVKLTEEYEKLSKAIKVYESSAGQIANKSSLGRIFSADKLDIEKAKSRLLELKSEIDSLKNKIKESSDENKETVSDSVDDVINKVKKGFEEINNIVEESNTKSATIETPFKAIIGDEEADKIRQLATETQTLGQTFDMSMKNIALSAQASFETAFQGILDGFEEVGEAIVNGENGWKAFSKGALSSIASVVDALATQLMAQAAAQYLLENYSDASYGFAQAAALKVLSGVIKANAGNFANGGIVGGNSYTGDKLSANVNSGELILNMAQQDAIASRLLATSQQQPQVNITVINNTDSQVGISQDDMGNIRMIIDSEINNYMTGPSGQKMLKSNYGISKVGVR